jgi:radical SAM superfamily enzyme YgiQ (UPF0313 family)
MRIVLVRPPVVHLSADVYGSIPGIPSGIAYLAAAVRASGHAVGLIDGYGEKPHNFYRYRSRYIARGLTPGDISRRIDSSTEVAGVSVHCAGEHSMACEILKTIRAGHPGMTTVVGGYHATFVPEAFIEAGADYVVLGEGEERLPRLLDSIGRGEDPSGQEGLATGSCVTPRTTGPVALENQPFAAVDLLPLENYWKLHYGHGPFAGRYMNIVTSRGCPYHCSFCQAPLMSGGRWTARSAEKVLEEMEWHTSNLGVRDFHIQDENFATDGERARRICSMLVERGSPVTFCFPSGVKMETLDDGLLELLARAGCRYISLSPETGSARVLSLMNKVADIEKVPALFRKAAALGIRTCAFMATGYPGETDADRRLTRNYVKRLAVSGVDEVIMPVVTPFPATPSMQEESLQGFGEYDELCFSPVWRPDYRRLDRFRAGVYVAFYATRLIRRPLAVLAQIGRLVTGRFGTKTEMTVYRKIRDIPDLLSAIVGGRMRPGRTGSGRSADAC